MTRAGQVTSIRAPCVASAVSLVSPSPPPPSPSRSLPRVRWLGEPVGLDPPPRLRRPAGDQGVQDDDRRLLERRSRTSTCSSIEAIGPRRPDRAPLDVVRRRLAARPLPDELPLLRAVRRARRARAARGLRGGLGRVRRRGLLSRGARRVPLERRRITCLPQNISSLVVYYNRDLFKRFGVPEPTDDMSWSQFVYRAQQLTRDAQGAVVRGADPDLRAGEHRPRAIYGLGVEPTIIRFAPFVWSNRGELVDDDEQPDALHARHARGVEVGARSSSSSCGPCTASCRPTSRSRRRTTRPGS